MSQPADAVQPPVEFTLDTSEAPSVSNPDRDKIGRGMAVPCRACFQIFRRVRFTFRFCSMCGHAFCEGEHMNFLLTGRGAIGRCVFCGPKIKEAP